MARRETLTDNMILKLKPEAKRFTKPDPELRGHYVRVTPKGARSFVAVARDPDGKQIWATIGGCDVMTIAEARGQELNVGRVVGMDVVLARGRRVVERPDIRTQQNEQRQEGQRCHRGVPDSHSAAGRR